MRRKAGSLIAALLVAFALLPGTSRATTSSNVLVTREPGLDETNHDLNGTPTNYSISGDGRYVAYEYFPGSDQPVPFFADHTGGGPSIFLFDRQTGTNTLVTKSASGPTSGDTANDWSQYPMISANGKKIVYQSNATDLVSGFVDDANSFQNVYIYDIGTQTNRLISHTTASETAEGNGTTAQFGYAAISNDGSHVGYRSLATNLVALFTEQNGANENDVYLYDATSRTNRLVSHDAAVPTNGSDDGFDGTVPPYSQELPMSISGTGRLLAYTSIAQNLVSGFHDNNLTQNEDTYLFDNVTGKNTLVTHQYNSKTEGSDGRNERPVISANGARIAFESLGDLLVKGFVDNNSGASDVFVWTRKSNSTRLVSFSATKGQKHGAGPTGGFNGAIPLISANGKAIQFASDADDLIKGFADVNFNQNDLYVWTQTTRNGRTIFHNRLISFEADNHKEGEFQSATPWGFSGDGKHVVFDTGDIGVMSGFVNNNGAQHDLYVFNLGTGKPTLVSHSTAGPLESANDGSTATASPRIISTIGSAIAFTSTATDLVGTVADPFPNNNGAIADLYRFGP